MNEPSLFSRVSPLDVWNERERKRQTKECIFIFRSWKHFWAIALAVIISMRRNWSFASRVIQKKMWWMRSTFAYFQLIPFDCGLTIFFSFISSSLFRFVNILLIDYDFFPFLARYPIYSFLWMLDLIVGSSFVVVVICVYCIGTRVRWTKYNHE